ncbi:ABC transporter permease [Alkalihalobacillus sp. AL-G]|uniref:cell division protein FtsX n=1 Tax=Alkalihalobacillus sp. AL-G TaxID=2926399 RepID=UPI00272D8D41|nr:permease-like cell division protein FtsX [Alkalihalobacillus sp. AL-G]WLD94521.1 permease-like cell division protein FtsX [Alkalihalobacillus sp. AL-G]
MNTLKYYLRDAREGIRRNVNASLAAILLIIISLSITGTLFMIKTGADHVVGFLESQVKIKVFVDTDMSTERVAGILQSKQYVSSVKVETKEEALARMQQFFKGKEYLFNAFKETELPDAISIELKNKENVEFVAKELKDIDGIADVIYAQDFAKRVISWSNTLNQYGMIILSVFMLASFLTISIAINLAMYQRQKDIRIKLLLGAKESHVRGQFLLEGLILGLIGSILASFVVYCIYQYGLYQLQLKFSYIFEFNRLYINLTLVSVIITGALIGLLGSYLSSRKLIKHG